MATISELLVRATAALDALATVGEEVADEWQYVTDLATVYRGRFAQVSAARGAEEVGPEVEVAVELAAEEAGLVADPHRAIDWLSTFPQVVLLAIGETA